MGLRMNAFGVILHEGSHGLLAKSRTLNDRLCNWAVPSGRSTRSRSTGRPTGSTTAIWGRSTIRTVFYLVPARRGALTALSCRISRGHRVPTGDHPASGTSSVSGAPASLLARPQFLLGKLVTQLIVLGQFVLLQGVLRGILFYAVFWLVPIVCMYPMILRRRPSPSTSTPACGTRACAWTARTSCAGWCRTIGRGQDGIPLRTPRPSHHSLSGPEEAPSPARRHRPVRPPSRSHLRRLRALPGRGGQRDISPV